MRPRRCRRTWRRFEQTSRALSRSVAVGAVCETSSAGELALEVGEDLAHRPGRRGVEVRPGRRPHPVLEPPVELVPGGGELAERASDVVPREVDDVEVALLPRLD